MCSLVLIIMILFCEQNWIKQTPFILLLIILWFLFHGRKSNEWNTGPFSSSQTACHTVLKFLSWDAVMKYSQLRFPLPFKNVELSKTSKTHFGCNGAAFDQSKLLLIVAEICLPIFNSLAQSYWTSDTSLLISLYEDLCWMAWIKALPLWRHPQLREDI